MLFFRRVYSA